MKKCNCCKEFKSMESFNKCKSKPDGLQPRCRYCDKEYSLKNRDANSERSRKWAIENKERKSETNAAWVKANKNRVSLINKRYYEKYPKLKSDRAIKWKSENRVRVAKNQRDWQESNRERVNDAAARYRVSKLNATPIWADKIGIARFYSNATALQKSTGIKHHVDHIVPLVSKYVCGLHCEANLRVLPALENLKKSNRHWPDMP